MPSDQKLWNLGDDFPIDIAAIDSDTGLGVVGIASDIEVTIQRVSDEQWWSGSSWGPSPTVLVPFEVDGTNLPGLYRYVFSGNTSLVEERYLVRINIDSVGLILNEYELHVCRQFPLFPLGSGNVTIRTVDEGSSPIDGVRVTILDNSDTFIAYGYTGGAVPGSGEAHFSVPATAGGTTYKALLYKEGVSFLPEALKTFVAKYPPTSPDFNIFEFEGATGMSGVMVTFAVVDTETPTPNPVEDVRVRIFSSPDDTFITELDTDAAGEASLILEGAAGPSGKEYIIRLSPPSGYYGGPTRTIAVIDPLGPSETNVFDFVVYPPSEVPVSTDSDMCRVSGCFTDPSLHPLKNVTLLFHPREGYPIKVIAGMPFSAEPTMVRNNIIASELHVTTDKNGRVEIDLPRESVFDVFVQGLGAGDHTLQASIYIPDAAGIDIQEILFPYLTSITYSTTALSLAVGESVEIDLTLASSNLQPIAGSEALNALLDFSSSDETKVTVTVTSEGTLLVTGIAAGSATIQASRVVGSFAPRRPDVPDLALLPSTPTITVT